jgi:hypothetical protein
VAPVDIEEHGAELQNSTASYHLFFWSRREKEEKKNARGQANGWLAVTTNQFGIVKTLPLLDQVRLAKAEAQLIYRNNNGT